MDWFKAGKMKESLHPLSGLQEVLNSKTEELKLWPMARWRSLHDKIDAFSVEHKGIKYGFEVHVHETGGGVKVMVECSRQAFFLSIFGRHRYFIVAYDGTVRDMTGDEFWSAEA